MNRCTDHGTMLDEAGACDDCIEAAREDDPPVPDEYKRFATALLNGRTHAAARHAVKMAVLHGVLTEAAATGVADEIDRLVDAALHPDTQARGPLDPPPPFVTYETMQQERKTLLGELMLVEAERDQLKVHARVEELAGEAWASAIALCEQYKGDGMRLHAAVTRVADLLNRTHDTHVAVAAVRAALVDHEHGTCGLCGTHVPDGGNADGPRISSVDRPVLDKLRELHSRAVAGGWVPKPHCVPLDWALDAWAMIGSAELSQWLEDLDLAAPPEAQLTDEQRAQLREALTQRLGQLEYDVMHAPTLMQVTDDTTAPQARLTKMTVYVAQVEAQRDALRTAVMRVDALVGTAESMDQKQVSVAALRVILSDLLNAAGDRMLACTLCGAPYGHKPGCEALGGYGAPDRDIDIDDGC